jgi:hypothetical protein
MFLADFRCLLGPSSITARPSRCVIPPALSRFRCYARSGTRPLRPRSLRPSVIPVLGRSRRSLAALALAATLALTWVSSCARRLRSSTAPVLGFFSSRLAQRWATPTLCLLYLGPHPLWRHPGSTSSARRPPDRPFRLGPPRLGRPSIGFPGSDPLGVDPLASAPIGSVPRLGPLGSATPGAARTSLTYGLSKARPLLAPWISAAPVLGRFGHRPLSRYLVPSSALPGPL